MIKISQPDEYFQQMDNSISDKENQIFPFIQGSNVLDAGCGSGKFLEKLLVSGFSAKGIDSSLNSFKEVISNNMENYFVLGDLSDMSTYFSKGEFSTIVFSSVLHEVYSYNNFSLDTVLDVIQSSYDLLDEGGRIIIRDGVRPMGGLKRTIQFEDINDVYFLKEYCRNFKGRKVKYQMKDAYTYSMFEDDAMEFLYTYTWGWDSFNREVREQYGILSLSDYIKFIANRLPGAKIKYAESYLQSGYHDNLIDKVKIYDENMNLVDFPDSNMVIVIEKGL